MSNLVGESYHQKCDSCGREFGNAMRETKDDRTMHMIGDLTGCRPFAPQVRKSWPETWIQFARLIASNRSTSPRLQVGAVIVTEDNTQVLAIGYNGMAKGEGDVPDSEEPGQSGAIHAETNALIKCDFNISKRKIMYLTHSPCRPCARQIVNAGIWRVVYDVEYRDASGIDLMRKLGVEVNQVQDAILMADEGSN